MLLLAIERTVMHLAQAGGGLWCGAEKAPWALVIRDGGGIRALNVDGQDMPLERLRQAVPELDAWLARL